MYSNQHSAEFIHRFFAGLADYVFTSRLGVANPPLIDYLSSLLVRFVRQEKIFHLRSLAGQPLQELAAMLQEAEQRIGEARRETYRHIGDFTLFWCGVYPEALSSLQRSASPDCLLNYPVQGKRSYFIASTIEPANEDDAPPEILAGLSEQFELCCYGLREVRREWERQDDDFRPPSPILFN